MQRTITLALCSLLALGTARAQTCDLVFFSDDGQKFSLIVDGDPKNAEPASRVVATGIKTESPVVVVRFADKSIPDIKKPGYFPLGKEYTVMITTNKKGERVLRPTGEAELGTARAEPAKPNPSNFQEDAPSAGQRATVQNGGGSSTQQTVTTTVTEQGTGTTDNVTINMGVPGASVNVNMNVTDGGGTGVSSQTTTTTTTTTSHSSSTTGMPQTATFTAAEEGAPAARHATPYRMAGYNGPVGCPYPMNASEFEEAKGSISSKNFEDTKMTMAKQIARDRCFTADQVKGIMQLFGFEDSKLDFAKFAYDRTYDIGNYYKVNDAFGFESSIEDLNEFIKAR